jgi:archaellum component FlaC
MNLHLPFFNLNSVRTRAIFAGTGAASLYGWLQFTSPDTLIGLLDLNSLLADPLNPMIIIPPLVAAGGVFLPKFINMPGKIRLPKARQSRAGNTQYAESGATLLEFGKNQDAKVPAVKDTVVKTVSAGVAQAPSSNSSPQPKEASPQTTVTMNQVNTTGTPAQIDESKISTIVDNKTGRIAEEVESVKKDMSSIKEDMQSLKSDIKELSSTFESSLVELKAFQSEMVNPVNFMRKYFELLDIKNVSDPVNVMMPIEQLVNSTNASDPKQGANAVLDPSRARAAELVESHNGSVDSKIVENQKSAFSPRKTGARTAEEFSVEDVYDMVKQQSGTLEDDEEYDMKYRRYASPYPTVSERTRNKNKNLIGKRSVIGKEDQELLRSSLECGLTPGKIMSIVSIVDEILASMGPDGIELILEQYRAIGLKPEEERLIYGVVKMLNESKLMTDDIIAMLYRFGQVLGINDQDAELQYMKIVANKRDKKKRMARDPTTKGAE